MSTELADNHPGIDRSAQAKPEDARTFTMIEHRDKKTGMLIGVHFDHQFARLAFAVRCEHNAPKDIRSYVFPVQDLFPQIGVTPEELRALADEIEQKRNHPEILADDVITYAMQNTDFHGKRVLDIGGFDGRYAKMALDRGARLAMCLDNRQWTEYGWEQPPEIPGVVYLKGDFLGWTEPVDVVLFFNVLYHLPDPIAALRHLRSITNDEMLLCSLFVWSDLPVWRCFEPNEVNPQDATVFWGPSPTGLAKGLRIAGWEHSEEVGRAVERIVMRCKVKESNAAS